MLLKYVLKSLVVPLAQAFCFPRHHNNDSLSPSEAGLPMMVEADLVLEELQQAFPFWQEVLTFSLPAAVAVVAPRFPVSAEASLRASGLLPLFLLLPPLVVLIGSVVPTMLFEFCDQSLGACIPKECNGNSI